MYNIYLGGKWRKIITYTVMVSTLCDVYGVALIKGVALYVLKQKGELIIPGHASWVLCFWLLLFL